jgi:hypothetical protein
MKDRVIIGNKKNINPGFAKSIDDFLERRKLLPSIRANATIVLISDPNIKAMLEAIAKPYAKSDTDCCVEGPESECECMISED